jgi:hypothetical protein
MKLSLISLTVVGLLTLSGCAHQESNTLRSQVDALEHQARNQDEQINALQSELARAKASGSDTFDQAWSWVKTHSESAWNSDTSVDARARLEKCWNDIKASSK